MICRHVCSYPFHVEREVHQMLMSLKKKMLSSINTWDIVTKVVTFCSVYQAPSYEPNFISLASISAKLAHVLSELFILEVTCTACSAGHLKNKWHAYISQILQISCYQSKTRIIWWHLVYQIQFYHFVTIHITQISMGWGKFCRPRQAYLGPGIFRIICNTEEFTELTL